MNEAWLAGDLSGVSLKEELGVLRRCVEEAVAQGRDVSHLIAAVIHTDPVAGADLVAGPRAIASEQVVQAAIPVLHLLEAVVPVSGLYGRLADLAPTLIATLILESAPRHSDASWWWRLSGRESVPGQTCLAVQLRKSPETTPLRALEFGYTAAVSAVAAQGNVYCLRAIHDDGNHESFVRSLSSALDSGCEEHLVAWTAAWRGPDVDSLFAAVGRRLQSSDGAAALRNMARGLPLTLAALDGD